VPQSKGEQTPGAGTPPPAGDPPPPAGRRSRQGRDAEPEKTTLTPEERRARRRRLVIEYVVIAAVAVLVAVLVQAYIVKPYRIPSESMETTLTPGDRVFVNRFIYHFKDIARGNIVVFKAPNTGIVLIKRAIGLPGDEIALKDGRVYINGRRIGEPYVRRINGQQVPTDPFANGRPWSLALPYKVPPGHYFMMGDNRIDSGDSRDFGPVPKSDVIGDAFFIYWPLNRIRIL
jgi:signal peptidase I